MITKTVPYILTLHLQINFNNRLNHAQDFCSKLRKRILLASQRRYSFIKLQTRSSFGIGVDKISLLIDACAPR